MNQINQIDLNLLKVFQAIFDERSLTLAGNRLCLSQPSISYSLRRLRIIFEDTLFVRTRTGMQPTPAAIALSIPISRALLAVEEALGRTGAFDPAVSTRFFRIHMSDMGQIAYLPPLCKLIHSLAPGIRLMIESIPAGEMYEALRGGKVDCAIGNLPFLKTRTHFELLFRDSYVCMMAKHAGQPKGKRLTAEEFLAFRHARIISSDNSHQVLESFCQGLGVERKVALDVPHFSAIPEILRQTDLVCTLPYGIARWFNRNGDFAIYNPPFTIPPTDITLHWHANFESDSGNRWIRTAILKTIRQFARDLKSRID